MSTSTNEYFFDCRFYVPARGRLRPVLPKDSGPRRLAKLETVTFDQLSDPEFHRLLAALETLPYAAATGTVS